MSKLLKDHLDTTFHNVVKDEAELVRYPVKITSEDGVLVIEVDYEAEKEHLGDVDASDTGLYCTTCDTEILD
jgi:hypothetical protein